MIEIKGKAKLTTGVIIIKENTVLLVKHISGLGHVVNTYGIPAGVVESEKDLKTIAAEELFEETGLTVVPQNLRRLSSAYYARIKRQDGTEKDYVLIPFTTTEFSGTLRTRTAETVPEWVTIDHLSKLELLPNILEAILEARELLIT